MILLMGCWQASSSHVLADWPLVRGNALATGVADSEVADTLQRLWEYAVPDSGFEATAVISAGIVYIGDMDNTFYALRLADGKLVWKQTFEDSGFATAAALAGDMIYVGDINGVLRALRADTGKEVWSYETNSDLYAAPNVQDATLLITTDSGELLALNAQTGDPQWSFKIEAPLRCWPTVVEGRIFLAGCDERLHAVDFSTGKEVEGLDIDGPTGSTPATRGKKIYFGTEAGTFYAISCRPMQVVWAHRDSQRSQSIRSSAAVGQRVVVYGIRGKQVVALDRATGKPRWTFPVRSRVENGPVIAGNLVFLATVRGRVIGVDVSSGDEKWWFTAGGSFLGSPAVADGKLVLGNTDGTLYCFE